MGALRSRTAAVFAFALAASAGAEPAGLCPASSRDWKAWRDSLVDRLRDGKVSCLEAQRKIRECSSFAGDEKSRDRFQECVAPLETFLEEAFSGDCRKPPSWPEASSYNALAAKASPWAVSLPPELARNGRFLGLLARAAVDGKTSVKAVREIQALVLRMNPGAKFLLYDSRHFENPGLEIGDLGRLLIYYPGKAVDQWLQIGVTRRPSGSSSQDLSLISVVKQGAPKRSFYQDFEVWQPARGKWALRSLARPGGGFTCVQCHPNGPNPIWGDPFGKSASPSSRAEELNRILREYGRVVAPGFKEESAHRPYFGVSVGRETASFGDCRQVARFMNCADCHNAGGGRGFLHSYPALLPFIRTAVQGGFMPPGNPLRAEARKLLYDCLVRELDPKPGAESGWLSHLKAQACGSPSPSGAAVTPAAPEPLPRAARAE